MSQNQAILDYLKAGNSLTGLSALKLMGTMKLASRISELRDEGFDIKDETIHDKVTGKHYKRYWIEQKETYTKAETAQGGDISPKVGYKAAEAPPQTQRQAFMEQSGQMAFLG